MATSPAEDSSSARTAGQTPEIDPAAEAGAAEAPPLQDDSDSEFHSADEDEAVVVAPPVAVGGAVGAVAEGMAYLLRGITTPHPNPSTSPCSCFWIS
jgi:hypothetical protein